MGGSKMDVATSVDTGKLSTMKIVGYALIALAVGLTPIIFQGFGQLFMVRIMAIVGLYVMLALGLNIVVGYAGLLDLGYVAFYAIGAYVAVLVTQTYMIGEAIAKFSAAGGKIPEGFSPIQMLTYGPAMQALATDSSYIKALQAVAQSDLLLPWLFLLCIPLAAAGAALTGVTLGTPVLRLRGDYLAIVTLGFGEIVRIVITNNVFGITGGAAGLPRPGVILPEPLGLKWMASNLRFSIPDLGARGFNFAVTANVYWYYVIVILCLVTIYVVRRLDDSRLGRSWVAMREDEVAAASMGVNIMTAKLWAFSLGALSGGIAGLVFVNFQGSVTPESFTFMESVFIVSIVVLGGMGSIPGVIVGALIIQGVPELIRGLAASGVLQLSGPQITAVSNYRFLVFGLLMVIMMAWRPQGIIPSKRRARELHPETEGLKDVENETLYDAQHETGTPGEMH